MKILLIGPPACGKGTIGRLLSVELGLPFVSVGNILRKLPFEFRYKKLVEDAMNEGGFVPNFLVAQVISAELNRSIYANGYILDGWLRLESDISYFDPKPTIVVFLTVNDSEVIRRVVGRRICETDGSIYNIYTSPPGVEGVCDLCGNQLTQRSDDTKEVAVARLKGFNAETAKSISRLRDSGILVEVDANGSITNVFAAVMAAVEGANEPKNRQ
ncbi:MAG: Adenylate kinase [candidate division WWE3 bacterium GW2011_GWA1_46_21]|uniref:Adenylate kinase n=4 Tax=Katanobacteria TaxID=422282 RepID=A0A0G1PHE0_UNCKA|nr:MAG: Adenylate kinase [candidate division WWE3 bacterium GW2011_GWA1_46_21]KKU49150.1 MAG: Adenylate kinase [candidate division WWE3 bacterium GW2011_GWA2_46_9]KKU50861.1 MAG: Adenylate kinase [candidate division WWE3 bacterium GW2011_GWC1_47_10]KKU58137.1 MAG: Adenylate kinase [candidate division WWE3 bacterium GW2011_GWB1_47_11]